MQSESEKGGAHEADNLGPGPAARRHGDRIVWTTQWRAISTEVQTGDRNRSAGKRRKGDTYLFALDLKENTLFNAAFPEHEGKNQAGNKDANGKLYDVEFVRVVQTKGSGWVDYLFPKAAKLVDKKGKAAFAEFRQSGSEWRNLGRLHQCGNGVT